MIIKSKFRKMFWIRIGIGFFVFLCALSVCINRWINPDSVRKEALMVAYIFLFFMAAFSLDFLRFFSLTVTENGIEKTSLVLRTKQYIPFSSIVGIENLSTEYKGSYYIKITDGFHYNIIKTASGETLIISPDSFENYSEIMLAIKSKIEQMHVA